VTSKERRLGVPEDREGRRQVGPPKRTDEPALAGRVAERGDTPGERARHCRTAIALLEYLLPEDDALAGDLLEAAPTRSRAWLWRQVLLGVPARLALAVRAHPRATLEQTLVATAMLALLGFHTVVAASLINHLLVLNDIAWIPVTGRYQHWQWHSVPPALLVAVAAGRAISDLHREHRIAAILLGSASATSAAFLNLFLFVPNVLLQPFVPAAALQTIISMIFIAGLFIGFASRRTCEQLSSV
jgi:hypothetical protein